jgi:xanthosine utilization system XapX-like protein
VERLLSRLAISLAAAVAALILVTAAIGFFGTAFYLLLVPAMPAPVAALVVGLAGLVLAGSIVLVVYMTSRRTLVRRALGSACSGRSSDINGIAAALGELAAREMSAGAQAHPYHAVALALLAGLAVGISPELRDILKGALKD